MRRPELPEPVFEARDVCYSYPGGPPILCEVNFSVRAGECVAVLGANASGKSTLLHLLDGLYFPTEGKVMAFGRELTEESVETPPFSREFRRQVGYLFQNSDAQLFCPTVEEELAFGPLQLRRPAEEVEARVADTLRLFGLEHLRERSPQTLSGGEKKKVALASIITCGPRVILADEPTADLDPRTQQWLLELLFELHRAGLTLVTATHDLVAAADLADRVIVLSEDHRVAADAPTDTVLRDLDLLLAVNLIHVHSHAHGSITHVHPHAHPVQHDDHEHPHRG
jgi:cobalt/nickel transport system ATP-binding protein